MIRRYRVGDSGRGDFAAEPVGYKSGTFSHTCEFTSTLNTAPHSRILQEDEWDKEDRPGTIPLTAFDKLRN